VQSNNQSVRPTARRGTAVRAAVLMACAAIAGPLAAAEIDLRPLTIKVEAAFPEVEWPGWISAEESGVVSAFRPILVTHAGDGGDRVFVPTEQGTIYVLPNDQGATQADVFVDLHERVAYDDKTNEEGFLGLVFHPRYRENGEFFVYYTNRHDPHQNVVARYRARRDDPRRADPDSEQILMTLDKPFWNHDAGTLAFGPDGYLYIATGDGGLANDPYGNGQNLSTLLGKILRIDVDRRDGDLAYAIPADNPFANQPDACGEIWAYGLRNVWRMAFDRQAGTLWAADVGQDTWEEIDLIAKGGNYGWNVREGLHPFVPKGAAGPASAEPRPDLIDPIWEYHHDVGKSITGGVVYRGSRAPELAGAYLYADYVAGKLWALWYDAEQRAVTANREIPLPRSVQIMSFGEDERGEVYFTTASIEGRGVWRFARAE